MIKAYLAGPDVFRSNAKEVLESKRRACATVNIQALTPLDNEFDVNALYQDTAGLIYKANIALIDQADIVIADITPFRGISLDPGTAFEIGYAIAKNKPVYAYLTDVMTQYKHRANISCRPENTSHPVVEDFGLQDNLMIAVGVTGIYISFNDVLEYALSCRYCTKVKNTND